MAFEKQINLYSVDTGDFFSNREAHLHSKLIFLRKEQEVLTQKLKETETRMCSTGYTKKDLFRLAKGNITTLNLIPDTYNLVRRYHRLAKLKLYKSRMIKSTKSALLACFSNKVTQNERTGGNDHTRVLHPDALNDSHVISLFESALTRTLKIREDELSTALIVVQVYYFDVFQDISRFGFLLHGEKYHYLSSSAGQIRKKKAVFIAESLWDTYEKSIMCGLTVSRINAKGGNNVNKYLAYMALNYSATNEWIGFDIEKSIVIDDFKTDVFGTYDFIDDFDYTIQQRTGTIPITHTDGAGMILNGKNRMIRLPWIKGLLGVFDFRKFILEARETLKDNSIGVISDIYGTKHDIIAENIEIIFTKSQFKMYKYYDSWFDYKSNFKKYNCQAAICREEEERIKNARLNYQMNQTLTDLTEEELSLIAAKSIDQLQQLSTSVQGMQRAFGVAPCNSHLTPLQEAIKIYPDLLTDEYLKITLRDIKDSLIKKYRSGKLEVEGKYTFLLPDFYAACEYWFLHIKMPEGLLNDGEVYCSLFPHREKLDCLRSPHLFKEHAIRRNAAFRENESRRNMISKWFDTKAIYTSCKDLISKILQFDVDGDLSLVIGEPCYVAVAERNMTGIVPLYYNMKKAAPIELNHKSIYEGLKAAFTGSNIGQYSNHIAKIWNSDIFVTGTEEEKRCALDAVRLLCMENNFCIDYAKTLYKPKRPQSTDDFLNAYTRKKLPHFFLYAKNKQAAQVEACNKSMVNRLEALIPEIRLNTRAAGLKDIDYRLLMHNPAITVDKNIIRIYEKLNSKWHFKINQKDDEQNNLHYLALKIRNTFAESGYTGQEITDMLIKHLYGNENPRKDTLWFCYGAFITENLKNNLKAKPTKYRQCTDCADWFEIDARNTKTCRCPACQKTHRLTYQKTLMQKKRKQSSC